MMTVEAIQDQVSRYLRSDIRLSELEDWLVANSWGKPCMEKEVSEVVYSIELRLAEWSLGHLSEQELRDALLQTCMVTRMFVSYCGPTADSARLSTASSSSISLSPIRWQSVDTRLSLAIL